MFPPEIITTLRYASRIGLAPASTVVGLYDYRGNSVYDPDATGTGGQPAIYAQLALIYRQYNVLSSSIKVIPISAASTNAVWDICVIPTLAQTDITGSNTMEELRSMKYSRYRMLNNQAGTPVIKSSMKTSNIYGVTDAAVKTEEEYTSVTTTNPANEWFWTIGCIPCDRTASATLYFDVMLTYQVVFKNLIVVDQS